VHGVCRRENRGKNDFRTAGLIKIGCDRAERDPGTRLKSRGHGAVRGAEYDNNNNNIAVVICPATARTDRFADRVELIETARSPRGV